MTVREKADDLYIRFRMRQTGRQSETHCYHQTIQCCHVAVDELINATQLAADLDQLGENTNDETKEYWKKVKEELKNVTP